MGDAKRLDALIGGRMIASPNYSSRRGAKVRLIVLHTTEGARTNASLGSWFGQRAAKCSSHVGIDDRNVVRFVPESYSAWTAGNANPVSTQAELCAFARWSVSEWERHTVMLENAARWVAAESIYHNIPLVRVRGAATRSGTGVCMHIDATRGFGGNHTDCGVPFSNVILDRVIARARVIVGQEAGVSLDLLESLMASINDLNIQESEALGGKKTSVLNLLLSAADDARRNRYVLEGLTGRIEDTQGRVIEIGARQVGYGNRIENAERMIAHVEALVAAPAPGDREAADAPDAK